MPSTQSSTSFGSGCDCMIICGVIPIRLDSKRFPGKGLARLAGKEIVLHVYDRALGYKRFNDLVVATDDPTIRGLIEQRGGEVFFSRDRFRNGSERVAAAAREFDCDICVNIQGDEVFVTPEAIDGAVTMLESRDDLVMATVAFPIQNGSDLVDPNLVKVKLREDDLALAFSRSPIEDGLANLGHVGIYAYRRDFLDEYTLLKPTADEESQSLEQLRILGHGYKIGVALIEQPLLAINTPSDLQTAENLLSIEGG